MILLLSFAVGFVAFFVFLQIKKTEFYKSWSDCIHMMRYGVFRLRCEQCNKWKAVRLEESRTLYPHDGKWFQKDNPNRPLLLCRSCAEMHHDYWDEMWSDYYTSVI